MTRTLPQVLHVAADADGAAGAFIAAALRELALAGVRQTLLHAGTPPAWPLPPGVRRLAVQPRPGPWGAVPVLRAAVRTELSLQPYGVIHLHAPEAGLAGRLALAGLAEHPRLFYSPHETVGDAAALGHPPMMARLAALAAGLRRGGAFRPVACDSVEAEGLRRRSGRRAIVLPHAVDPRLFDLPRAPRGTLPRVLAFGHARAPFEPARFAELAARFHFAGAPAQFVWAGEGDEADLQVLRAADVEIVPPATLHAELARADVVVHLVRGPGAPRPLAYAMAAGIACVVNDAPTHRDLVRHRHTGLIGRDLGTLALHVKALLDDPVLAFRLGEAARREATQRFHPSRLRQALLALYRLPVQPPVLQRLGAGAVFDPAAAP